MTDLLTETGGMKVKDELLSETGSQKVKENLLTETGSLKVKDDVLTETGSQKMKHDLLTETGSLKVKDDLLSSTAGSVGGNWNSGPILFPYLDGDSYESSDDGSDKISIPRPPAYVPYPRASCRDDAELNKSISVWNDTGAPDDTALIGGSCVQKRGEDGRYDGTFYAFAKEVLEWYSNKKGRKFEFVDLLEVVLRPVVGIVCDLTMKAVDGEAPMESPVIFKGKYWWGKYREVVSCEPLINTAGSKQKRDSDPPALGAEGSKFLQYCSMNVPVRKIVKGDELAKRDSDPRISRTELSRVRPPPVLIPGGQNVKDNEPKLSRDEEPIVKSQYCEDYFSDGGCENEMCRFAHGDWELNEPLYIPPKDAIVFHPSCGKLKRGIGVFGPPPFTAKAFPYINESHIGIVFGKRGELCQWICDLTGVKLTVENNEQVVGFKKIVISGTTSRCNAASTLVKVLLGHFISFSERERIPPVIDYKTRLCKKYAEGHCKRDAKTCCFAHGKSELRLCSVQILQSTLEARREGKDFIPSS